MTEKQLEHLINVKRAELEKSFDEQGLNNFTLKKSQELDTLLVKIQRIRLEEILNNSN